MHDIPEYDHEGRYAALRVDEWEPSICRVWDGIEWTMFQGYEDGLLGYLEMELRGTIADALAAVGA